MDGSSSSWEGSKPPEELQVMEFARRAKAAYAERYSIRMKRKYSPNPRADSLEAWKRVARTCIRLHAEPEHYIEAQFMYSRSLPFPNTLHADTACKRYATYKNTRLYVAPDEEVGVDTSAKMISPGRVVLEEMLSQTSQYLANNLGNSDLRGREVQDYILRAPWQLDPVAVLTLCPEEPYMGLYARSAVEKLEEHPELEQALREDTKYASTLALIHDHVRKSAGR